MKQKELSVLLRVIVFICALAALVFGTLVCITAAKSILLDRNWESVYLTLTVLLFVPLFAALWELWRIFTEIGRDNSFCLENAMRLRRVSFYALADTILELVSVLLFVLCCAECSFGWIFLKLFFMLVGIAMAVACAALSHLTRKAALLKDENDLTI